MRKSHVSRENLMCQENISYLIIFGSPPTRKSHVFSVLAPPNEKIFCLLSHEKISCLKRKSHVLSVLGPPPTRISPISCLKRKSHVLSVCGPSSTRKSPVSCLITKWHV